MSPKFFKCTLAAALIPFGFQIAVAEDAGPETRGDETCFPIKTAMSRLKAAELKPDRRDTVDSFLEAYFAEAENRSLPMKLYLKYNAARNEFVVSPGGEVEDLHSKILAAPKDAEICGLTREDGKIGIVMSPSVRFINNSGIHPLTEILDAVRDGKSHHKKNLGGVQAMFVPKMTHIAIIYDDPAAVPKVSAIVNGASIPVQPDSYGKMWVIDVEGLEEIKTETLTIGGGSYKLLPVPSIKEMKSLGIE